MRHNTRSLMVLSREMTHAGLSLSQLNKLTDISSPHWYYYPFICAQVFAKTRAQMSNAAVRYWADQQVLAWLDYRDQYNTMVGIK